MITLVSSTKQQLLKHMQHSVTTMYLRLEFQVEYSTFARQVTVPETGGSSPIHSRCMPNIEGPKYLVLIAMLSQYWRDPN